MSAHFHGHKKKKFSMACGCEFYLKESAYNILQNKLKGRQINFKLSEFREFPDNLDGKYGSILLSNIYNYYNGREHVFFDAVKALIDNNLTPNGTMQMHYDFLDSKQDFDINYKNNLVGYGPYMTSEIDNPILNPYLLMKNSDEYVLGQDFYEEASRQGCVADVSRIKKESVCIYLK